MLPPITHTLRDGSPKTKKGGSKSKGTMSVSSKSRADDREFKNANASGLEDKRASA